MAAINTETQLANLALSYLGARRINDLDTEMSNEAKSCRLHYHSTRDDLLARYQWDFATTRTPLVQLATPPASEWTEAWQLPTSFVRLIRIIGKDPHNPHLLFAKEGRTLLTSGLTTCTIVFISNATLIQDYDPLFVTALSLALAARIATDITQDDALSNKVITQFTQLALPIAMNTDARQANSGENHTVTRLISQSALVNARYRADGRPPY